MGKSAFTTNSTCCWYMASKEQTRSGESYRGTGCLTLTALQSRTPSPGPRTRQLVNIHSSGGSLHTQPASFNSSYLFRAMSSELTWDLLPGPAFGQLFAAGFASHPLRPGGLFSFCRCLLLQVTASPQAAEAGLEGQTLCLASFRGLH